VSASDDTACREIVEVVTEYLDGAMPPAERSRFDDHMRICPGCATYLEQMRSTIRLAGTLAPEAVTPEAKAAFLAALRGWKARKATGA